MRARCEHSEIWTHSHRIDLHLMALEVADGVLAPQVPQLDIRIVGAWKQHVLLFLILINGQTRDRGCVAFERVRSYEINNLIHFCCWTSQTLTMPRFEPEKRSVSVQLNRIAEVSTEAEIACYTDESVYLVYDLQSKVWNCPPPRFEHCSSHRHWQRESWTDSRIGHTWSYYRESASHLAWRMLLHSLGFLFFI